MPGPRPVVLIHASVAVIGFVLLAGGAVAAAGPVAFVGLAVPHLAVDLPGGGGKITLQPEYRIGAGAEPRGDGT